MKKIKLIISVMMLLITHGIHAQTEKQSIIDGAKYYNYHTKSVPCEVVTCSDMYKNFKGSWTGNFESYNEKIKGFRPFNNSVYYDEHCYKNLENGELFIVGLKIDIYPEYKGLPAKTDTSFLITGITGEEKPNPFLRTVDKENGLIEYKKVFEDVATEMSIWEYNLVKKEKQPEMKFRIIDFRNISNTKKNERFVFISMQVGPQEKPYWQGLIVKGSHTKEN